MIKEITIRNYKSIHDLTMELGHVNVLIGENGCGKTNILEAVAMLGAARKDALDITGLTAKGLRITKPNLTMSSFLGQRHSVGISLSATFSHIEGRIKFRLVPLDPNDIYSKWVEVEKVERNEKRNITGNQEIDNVGLLGQLVDQFLKRDDLKVEELDDIYNKLDGVIGILRDKIIAYEGDHLPNFLIFNLNTQALRGISSDSLVQPLGVFGEGLDVLLSDFSKEEWEELLGYSHLISWLEEIIIDQGDKLKFKGHKLGRSNSILYFRDKFMRKNNNVFAAENSNEGVLHILFYLALFISKKTPKFFAIDNIETALNPKLCRTLMKELAALAVKHDKQVLITTHNPAVLDGINLHDDTQRLFVISRDKETGHTGAKRIKMKPASEGKELKLSEMWMRGSLGAIPTNF